MQYLITLKDNEPFVTNYYDYENHYIDGMTVYNLLNYTYTTDGINWDGITEDHL